MHPRRGKSTLYMYIYTVYKSSGEKSNKNIAVTPEKDFSKMGHHPELAPHSDLPGMIPVKKQAHNLVSTPFPQLYL